METQPASINDIMSTTFGGMALEETTYRLSSLVLNGQARGWERASHELVAAFLNPVRAVNRLMTGEACLLTNRGVCQVHKSSDKSETISFILDDLKHGYRRR